MTDDRDHLEQIAARLRDERPQADAPELDRIKLRVLGARTNAGRAWLPAAIHLYGKGTLMTSRIAITVLLALGIMMSATGATLAVSGLTDADSAAQVQYPPNNNGDEGGREEGGGQGGEEAGGGGGSQAVLAGEAAGGNAQAAEQVAAGGQGGNLAFTGFAALPLLVLGVGLFGAGLVMRRRSRADSA